MTNPIRWTLAAVSTLVLMLGASSALADTFVFGTDAGGDGLQGFTVTGIDGTTTTLTPSAGSVQYRNENVGSQDVTFIRQFTSLVSRTPDTGNKYTVSGTFTVSDGYADDNNRIGLVLFTDPTTALSRNNLGQIGIVWNTDDNTVGGAPGSNASDNLSIYSGYNNLLADATVPSVLRDQTIPFAQDLLQGAQITLSSTFWFTGTNINIEATMTDAGGVTQNGTAVVEAADYVGDYFGFSSTYRARNYDGTPDPTGATRDNPLVLDYETFELTVIPEPSTLGLMGMMGGALLLLRRRIKRS